MSACATCGRPTVPPAAYPRTSYLTTKRIQNARFVAALEAVREPSSQAHVAAFLERTGQKHFERILGAAGGAYGGAE